MKVSGLVRNTAFGFIFFTPFAYAEKSPTQFTANLWVDEANCESSGQNQSVFKIQAHYYDSVGQELTDLPVFALFSPNKSHPFAFSMSQSMCVDLLHEIGNFEGKLNPIQIYKVNGQSNRTVTYPCGIINRKTGYRGSCTKNTSIQTFYIHYDLKDYRFTSESETE